MPLLPVRLSRSVTKDARYQRECIRSRRGKSARFSPHRTQLSGDSTWQPPGYRRLLAGARTTSSSNRNQELALTGIEARAQVEEIIPGVHGDRQALDSLR